MPRVSPYCQFTYRTAARAEANLIKALSAAERKTEHGDDEAEHELRGFTHTIGFAIGVAGDRITEEEQKSLARMYEKAKSITPDDLRKNRDEYMNMLDELIDISLTATCRCIAEKE